MIRIHCMKKTPFSKGKKRWGRKLGLTGFRVESKDVNQETQSLHNEQQRDIQETWTPSSGNVGKQTPTLPRSGQGYLMPLQFVKKNSSASTNRRLKFTLRKQLLGKTKPQREREGPSLLTTMHMKNNGSVSLFQRDQFVPLFHWMLAEPLWVVQRVYLRPPYTLVH